MGKIETEEKRKRNTPEPPQPPAHTWIFRRSLSSFVWIKAFFPPSVFLSDNRNSSTLHHSATPEGFFFFFLSLKKLQRNVELWGAFLIRGKNVNGGTVALYGTSHLYPFNMFYSKPITSKPSIRCKTKAYLRMGFLFYLSSLINNTLAADTGALWTRMWELHSENNRGCDFSASVRVGAWCLSAKSQRAILI